MRIMTRLASSSTVALQMHIILSSMKHKGKDVVKTSGEVPTFFYIIRAKTKRSVKLGRRGREGELDHGVATLLRSLAREQQQDF